MIRLFLSNPYAILALLLALSAGVGGVYLKGRHDGASAAIARQEAAEARLEKNLKVLGAEATSQAAALLEAEAERDRLADLLEEAAHADQNADIVVLPADSVRRIFSR